MTYNRDGTLVLKLICHHNILSALKNSFTLSAHSDILKPTCMCKVVYVFERSNHSVLSMILIH